MMPITGTTYSSDALRRLVSRGTQQYFYDGAGRLRSIGDGAGLEQYGYERDAKGRITDFRLENVSRGYSYDGNDQLLTSPFRSYEYDDNFNRLGTGTQIGKDNRLAQDGDWNYEYDANGNLVAKRNFDINVHAYPAAEGHVQAVFHYDLRNRLTKVSTTTYQNEEYANTWVRYRYDAEDRMVERSTSDNGFTTEYTEFFSYDGPNPVLLTSSSGTVISRFLYGLGEDEIFAQDTSGQRWWLMGDHQGSVRKVLREGGSVARRIDYDEFGNILSNKGTGPDPRQTYTGQIWDEKSGLYYFGARFYDPTIGRFLNQDPIREGSNWYAYVGNNPMNLWDPTGLAAFGGSGFTPSASLWGASAGGAVIGGGTGSVAWPLAKKPLSGEDGKPLQFVENTTGMPSSALVATQPTWREGQWGRYEDWGTRRVFRIDDQTNSSSAPVDRLYFGPFDVPQVGAFIGPFYNDAGHLIPRARIASVYDTRTYSIPGRFYADQLSRADAELAVGWTTVTVKGRLEVEWTTKGAEFDVFQAWTGTVDRFKRVAGETTAQYASFTQNMLLTQVGLTTVGAIKQVLSAGVGGAVRGPKVDNRFGHNRMIRQVAREVTSQGDEVIAGGRAFDGIYRKEMVIATPGGFKNTRRPDLLVRRPDGSVYGINVGRVEANGAPMLRERQAIQDLNEQAGLEMRFVPYGASR